ncbi:hypothetical protein BY996DRAFT_6621606 [Phakopsora pachyrhizi]|uniref:Uncharacterized protein n=1 Tax=Phakopsora pachyrhizi TaxID=170000 RepID=A0AAV0BF08_PHAPC|nr:hypothetical protein BY996DRAFT_6621606 [Phakopsora pachyrhizi]CAH7685842.1 hypothetical protein PPACK8108_LOCUS20431 [Phakopsora pachyrhizi]
MKIGFSGAAGGRKGMHGGMQRQGLGRLGRVVLGLAPLGLRQAWKGGAWSKAGQGHMDGFTAGFGLGQAWEGGAWLGFYLGLKGRHRGKSIAICLGVAKEAGR